MAVHQIRHLYIVLVLVLCIVALAVLFLQRSRWRMALIAGALSLPGSFLTGIFVPEYWQPVRLLNWSLGIEDVLFSFATGALAWTLVSRFVVNKNCSSAEEMKGVVIRYLKIWGLAIVLFSGIEQFEGISIMVKAMAVTLLVSLFAARRRLNLLPLALYSAALFGTIYTFCIVISFQVFPHFARQWNWENLSGLKLLSVPLEEVLWCYMFGFCWTLLMSYFIDARRNSTKLGESLAKASQDHGRRL